MNIEINLEEHARSEMYEQLCEQFGEDEVHDTLEQEVIKHITQMYDNREQLEEQINADI